MSRFQQEFSGRLRALREQNQKELEARRGQFRVLQDPRTPAVPDPGSIDIPARSNVGIPQTPGTLMPQEGPPFVSPTRRARPQTSPGVFDDPIMGPPGNLQPLPPSAPDPFETFPRTPSPGEPFNIPSDPIPAPLDPRFGPPENLAPDPRFAGTPGRRDTPPDPFADFPRGPAQPDRFFEGGDPAGSQFGRGPGELTTEGPPESVRPFGGPEFDPIFGPPESLADPDALPARVPDPFDVFPRTPEEEAEQPVDSPEGGIEGPPRGSAFFDGAADEPVRPTREEIENNEVEFRVNEILRDRQEGRKTRSELDADIMGLIRSVTGFRGLALTPQMLDEVERFLNGEFVDLATADPIAAEAISALNRMRLGEKAKRGDQGNFTIDAEGKLVPGEVRVHDVDPAQLTEDARRRSVRARDDLFKTRQRGESDAAYEQRLRDSGFAEFEIEAALEDQEFRAPTIKQGETTGEYRARLEAAGVDLDDIDRIILEAARDNLGTFEGLDTTLITDDIILRDEFAIGGSAAAIISRQFGIDFAEGENLITRARDELGITGDFHGLDKKKRRRLLARARALARKDNVTQRRTNREISRAARSGQRFTGPTQANLVGRGPAGTATGRGGRSLNISDLPKSLPPIPRGNRASPEEEAQRMVLNRTMKAIHDPNNPFGFSDQQKVAALQQALRRGEGLTGTPESTQEAARRFQESLVSVNGVDMVMGEDGRLRPAPRGGGGTAEKDAAAALRMVQSSRTFEFAPPEQRQEIMRKAMEDVKFMRELSEGRTGARTSGTGGDAGDIVGFTPPPTSPPPSRGRDVLEGISERGAGGAEQAFRFVVNGPFVMGEVDKSNPRRLVTVRGPGDSTFSTAERNGVWYPAISNIPDGLRLAAAEPGTLFLDVSADPPILTHATPQQSDPRRTAR